MSLNDWLRYGWLVEHEPSAGEIRDLFAVIDRDLRNLGGYERAGAASFQEAGEMIVLAREISQSVRHWLAEEHPELL